MLSREDNDRITRVGPGTPGGNLFRRYWQPAVLSSELAENDGAPVRVRLLGEDLLAFRDSEGKVGLVDAYCPHRRAPLFFGRNEECGIRCVYHGWKFDVTGACTDMPSEPADSTFKNKVRLKSYPTVERGGLVWTYMGPPETMPGPPDYEWLRAPETHRFCTKVFERCNYLQGLEGGLDSSHTSFLHRRGMGDKKYLSNRDGAPRLEVDVTPFGFSYSSIRRYDAEQIYVRLYHFMMPAQQVRPGVLTLTGDHTKPSFHGHIWVPVDDENTWVYNWAYGYDHTVPLSEEYKNGYEAKDGRAPEDYVPGTFFLRQNRENDYLIDRQLQKTSSFTGIPGVNTQDFAMQEGMGAIPDRSEEHLGTSDRAIIAARRMLSDAISAVQRGETPPGADPATYRNARPHDAVVRKGTDWRQAFASETVAKF
jgi:phthalate 4,5-dioxygenase oxygenase subunit